MLPLARLGCAVVMPERRQLRKSDVDPQRYHVEQRSIQCDAVGGLTEIVGEAKYGQQNAQTTDKHHEGDIVQGLIAA